MDDAAYREAYKGSAMKRAKLAGLRRNAAVVLGNVGESEDTVLLELSRDAEADDVIREHLEWSLGRLRRRNQASG
jgi:epoxyqueuosine reductase